MWNRIELKERAKAAIRRNYWKCVLVALIAAVILGSNVTYRQNLSLPENSQSLQLQQTAREEYMQIQGLHLNGASIALNGGLSLSLLHIFVFSILEIGCDKFFLRNAEDSSDLGQVLDGFRTNYGRNVLTMFLTRLFIVLWTFLFVIPGIVKAYSYMLVPYILADNPDISRRDALALSEQMMRGNKMNAFILDLSFIGWHLLTVFTAGIVGIFFTNPYIYATKAELYRTLRYSNKIEA